MKLIKRITKILVAILLVAVLINVGTRMYTGTLIKESKESCPKAECAIILGAGVFADGTPGVFLEERLNAGIELYREGYVDKLLLTGDNGQVEYNEVEVMKNYAINAGVDEEDIFMDHAGFSTYESMYRADYIFNVKSAIVVTQRYHLYRALMIGKFYGIDVTGYPAEDYHDEKDRSRRIREFFAIDKDFAKSVFRFKPTYLGDEIPITGDGRLSWD